MYGRKDLVKITTLTNLSAILRTIKTAWVRPWHVFEQHVYLAKQHMVYLA